MRVFHHHRTSPTLPIIHVVLQLLLLCSFTVHAFVSLSNSRAQPTRIDLHQTTSTSRTSNHASRLVASTLTPTLNLSSNGTMEQADRQNKRRYLIVPLLYSFASLALIYKSYTTQVTNLPDAALYVSTAALCLFNISNADRKRLAASHIANSQHLGLGTISIPEQIDEAEAKRYAAQCYSSALAVKTFGQILGLLRMIRDRNPSGGASLFMATQVVYFVVGGGKYRHTDDGDLSPLEDRLVVGASSTYGIFTLAALVAGRAAVGSTTRGVGAGIYCFGCLTGAFDGVMSIMFGSRKRTKPRSG